MPSILARFACLLMLALLVPAQAQTADKAGADVAAVVQRFHAALAAGDAKAATELLAPDAVILEAGDRESRQQYLEHHLAEDIKFARSVPSTRQNLQVTLSGEVAWVSSTSIAQGSLEGRQLKLLGAELVVLSRSGSGWLIRAIHWSSRKAP